MDSVDYCPINCKQETKYKNQDVVDNQFGVLEYKPNRLLDWFNNFSAFVLLKTLLKIKLKHGKYTYIVSSAD